MADISISFEEARAAEWYKEVDEELKAINQLNAQIQQCMNDLQDDDDPVIHVLKEVARGVQNYGNALKSAFQTAMTNINSAIKRYTDSHQKVYEDAQRLSSNIGGK